MHAAFTSVSCVPKEAKRLSFSEVFRISLEGILLGLNFSNIFLQRLQSYWDVDSLIDEYFFLGWVDIHQEYVVPGHSLLGPAPRECRGGTRFFAVLEP